MGSGAEFSYPRPKSSGGLMKSKEQELDYCYCGLPTAKIINGVPLCKRHEKPKAERSKIEKWSGPSKTPYGSYENR